MSLLSNNLEAIEMTEVDGIENRTMDKLDQIDNIRRHISDMLLGTNWAMLFSNTDLAVTFIEAKAKLMEADKKFDKIQSNLLDDLRLLAFNDKSKK